jgi:Thiolase, N-terminal domain
VQFSHLHGLLNAQFGQWRIDAPKQNDTPRRISHSELENHEAAFDRHELSIAHGLYEWHGRQGLRLGTDGRFIQTITGLFTPHGMTTAGNSSQTTDGAAVVLLTRRGSTALAVWKGHAVEAVPPVLMGIGQRDNFSLPQHSCCQR